MSALHFFSKKLFFLLCAALVVPHNAIASKYEEKDIDPADFYSTTVTIAILDTLDRESDKTLLEYLIRRLNNTSRQ